MKHLYKYLLRIAISLLLFSGIYYFITFNVVFCETREVFIVDFRQSLYDTINFLMQESYFIEHYCKPIPKGKYFSSYYIKALSDKDFINCFLDNIPLKKKL